MTRIQVWWTFKVFGHQSIGILDGGLLKWVSEGRKTESGEPEPIQEKGKYKAQFNKDLVRDLKEMVEMVKSNMEKKTELNQIVDARPAGR